MHKIKNKIRRKVKGYLFSPVLSMIQRNNLLFDLSVRLMTSWRRPNRAGWRCTRFLVAVLGFYKKCAAWLGLLSDIVFIFQVENGLHGSNWKHQISLSLCHRYLGERQRIAFRFMLSSCVCVCVSVCVCLSACLCVYAAFVDLRKTVWDRDVVFLNCAE